jgi:hypothetical protein
MTEARVGVGPSRIYNFGKPNTDTWGNYGSMRLGVFQKRLDLIAGIDLTSFRMLSAPKKSLDITIQGNELLFFLGYSKDDWNLWGSVGGGQIRSYETKDGEQLIRRFVEQIYSAGASYDIYRAQYGKINIGLSWARRTPESRWFLAYSIDYIESLQFEFGIKLLGW